MTKLYPTKCEDELLWITKDGEESLWIATTDYEGRKQASECFCIVRGDRAEIVRKLERMMDLEPYLFSDRVFMILDHAEADGHCISGYPDSAQYDSVTLCRRVTSYMCPPKCHKRGWFYKDEPVEGISLSTPKMSIEYALDVLGSVLGWWEAQIESCRQLSKVKEEADVQERVTALQMAIDSLEDKRREEVRSLDG